MSDLPPKPQARAERVSLWRYMKLFREDILSAQPERLYRAWMAEFRTPFFRSYMINQPSLVDEVLKARPLEFPKSDRVGEGLRPLLGNSVFLTNGADWQRQRRIIDPAFEGGRLRDTFPAMWDAGQAAVARMAAVAGGEGAVGEIVEVEEEMSHVAADVIFRTLFSLPIEADIAAKVFHAFRAYQRTQPILNAAAFLPLPWWMPKAHRAKTRANAQAIRALIAQMTEARLAEIEAGEAPHDLATKIMTTEDPETGKRFTSAEMVDQVAIFFLAGHETSASALGWALYLLARYPDWQEKVAQDAADLPETPDFAAMSQLRVTRDVFRETLRLYPPVPMMVRETIAPETFRSRAVRRGSQIVISPWHLHRQPRLWDNPDGFDPARWKSDNGKACMRDAFIPFSAGSRVCPGAGFAMIEGVLLLAMLVRRFRFDCIPHDEPIPVAHLTVRSKEGIRLRVSRRLES